MVALQDYYVNIIFAYYAIFCCILWFIVANLRKQSYNTILKGGVITLKIGQRIKERRKELKISADELAKRLNKDRSTIYRYENGDIENLPLDILAPIAKALETSPAYLMGWDKNEEETMKKIDVATDILIRMEKDKNFSDVVFMLHKLDSEKLMAVKMMLNSFSQ